MLQSDMPWEVRWFDNDMENHKEAVKWFESIKGEFSLEKRTDRYVALQSTEAGIKIRGEIKKKTPSHPKMELKWRKRRHPDFQLLDKIAGIAEEWIKWSWEVKEMETTEPIVSLFSNVPDGPLLAFEKERLLRRYRIGGDNKIEAAKRIPIGDSGIMGEITRISFDKNKWWSLGIEAFGPMIDLALFENLSVQIFADCPLVLDDTRSFGYPHWIKSHVMHRPLL